MSLFSQVSTERLRALADALDSGRLTGLDRLAMEAFLSPTAARQLSDQRLDRTHLSYMLRVLIADRESARSLAPTVDLVWTGPEGSVSSSRDTGVVVRELFASAKESVLVVGFAVHRGREIFKQLSERMDEIPSLDVRMFLNVSRALRDTTRSDQLLLRFAADFKRQHWSGKRFPEIYYDPRSLATDETKRTSLHAKCVVVDGAIALVTSANFTEAAQQRNIEVGALIHDQQFARCLLDQFEPLTQSGAVARLAIA